MQLSSRILVLCAGGALVLGAPMHRVEEAEQGQRVRNVSFCSGLSLDDCDLREDCLWGLPKGAGEGRCLLNCDYITRQDECAFGCTWEAEGEYCQRLSGLDDDMLVKCELNDCG